MSIQIPQFETRNGAEAIVELTTWYGQLAIRKKRVPKTYRNPKLDLILRSRRTKEESIILHHAKLAGVLCPSVLFADPENCEIVMEYIQGALVKDLLEDPKERKKLKPLLLEIGRIVARLHKGKISHGDLTTKNILVKEKRICLIDFGLSFFSERIEDRADDLHLLKLAMKNSVSSPFAFSAVLKGYEAEAGNSQTRSLLRQVGEIERRGRYARVD